MTVVPSFPSNCVVVISKRVKAFDADHNATYVYTEVFNGDAWLYSVNDFLLENGVPIARESVTLFISSIDPTIDESCFLTVDGVEYRIIDPTIKRRFSGSNHTEIRVERRKT